ncbi:MAG: phosphoglycerate kinase [Pseudomonadota bacterium]
MAVAGLDSIDETDVAGKTVLVRADFNVPMANGKVTDATRIERAAPGITSLADRGATVVVLSHFGRPKGARWPDLSLAPIAEAAGGVFGKPVAFADDCVGAAARQAIESAGAGGIVLLENLRFHAGEEANDDAFAADLAALGDLYVNDAFSCAHRAHASTAAITQHMPSYAGPLLLAEVEALQKAVETPTPPTMAVVGGAKVSTKIPVLTNLVEKVDKLVVGGGMANTFLLANGFPIGKSLAEPDFIDTARAIMTQAAARNCAILLPQDVTVATEFKAHAPSRTSGLNDVLEDEMILDVGPATIAMLIEAAKRCKTVLWNGPLGAFEMQPFDTGTVKLAEAVATATDEGHVVSVAGGGDTVAALNAAGVADRFSYVSTAGGAFLEWLEGRELPGIAALAKASP